jgi:hypothetical protein
MTASNPGKLAGHAWTIGTPRTGASCGVRGRWQACASLCSQLMVASRRRRFSFVTSLTACAAERAARSQASVSASRWAGAECGCDSGNAHSD